MIEPTPPPPAALAALDAETLSGLRELAQTQQPVATPSAEEIQATYAAAAATLKGLQALAMPAATQRALHSVLRYWSFWHRAVFGVELPLLEAPRRPVPADAVLMFIAHHAPERHGECVRTGMPDWVRRNVAALEAVEGKAHAGRRRVAGRAAHLGLAIDADVPALKTVQQRVTLLGTLHRQFGLKAPQDSDGRVRPMMTTLAKAVKASVVPALAHAKRAVLMTQTVAERRGEPLGVDLQDLLDACGRGAAATWEGRRDKAMLLAAFTGGGRRRSEVMRMQQQHLRRVGITLADGEPVDGYNWEIHRLKGRLSDRADAPLLTMPLLGAAAEAIDDWLDVLRLNGLDKGPVWRRVYRARSRDPAKRVEVLGAPLKPEALASIVQARARQCLVARLPADQDPELRKAALAEVDQAVAQLGAHSLRSGFVTSQLAAGIDALSVAQMSAHANITGSFRLYDQRALHSNPGLSLLMNLQI